METQKYRQTNKQTKNESRTARDETIQTKTPPQKNRNPITKTDFVYLSLMLLLLKEITSDEIGLPYSR